MKERLSESVKLGQAIVMLLLAVGGSWASTFVWKGQITTTVADNKERVQQVAQTVTRIDSEGTQPFKVHVADNTRTLAWVDAALERIDSNGARYIAAKMPEHERRIKSVEDAVLIQTAQLGEIRSSVTRLITISELNSKLLKAVTE